MNIYNVTSQPRQKLSDKEKTKEWYIENVEYAVKTRYLDNDTIRKNRTNKIENYNIWNGIIDEEAVEEVFNSMHLKDFTTSSCIQNYPIEVSKFERLAGEESQRKFDYQIKALNEDVKSIKDAKKKEELLTLVEQHIQAESFSKEELQKNLQTLEKYYNYDYKDIREERGMIIANYLWRQQEFDMKFNKSFYDVLLNAEEIFACDIIGGEPILRKCDIINTIALRHGTSYKIEDSDIIMETSLCSPASLIDEYKEYLTEEDIDDIENRNKKSGSNNVVFYNTLEPSPIPISINNVVFSSANKNSNMLSNNYNDYYDVNGNILKVRVVWKSYRKVNKLKYYDENDKEKYDWVTEDYKPDKLKGEEITPLWILEWYEATKIGHDKYVKMQPYPVNVYDMDSLKLLTSPYIGTIYNTNTNKAISLMDRVKIYKFQYNMYQTRLDLAFAKWEPMTELDIAKKPEHWEFDKWMTYAKVHGYLIVDSFAESNKAKFKGMAAGNFNTTGRVLQIELGNFIQQLINILGYIERQVSLVSGINPEREGQGTTTNTLGGMESQVQNSSFITQQYYYIHDNTKLRVLQNMIEVSKVAWKGRQKKLPYIFDDTMLKLFDIDGDEHMDTMYNIFAVNSTNVTNLFNELKRLAPVGLQNDKMNFSQIMDMYMKNSISGIRRTIEKAEQDKITRDGKAQEAQLADAKEQRDLALKLKQAEMELEKYKIDTEVQTKLRVAEIGIYNRQLELDQNNNGIPDPMEIADLSLKEREHLSKKESDDRKLLLEEKIAKMHNETEKYKADKGLEKERLKDKTALKNKVSGEK